MANGESTYDPLIPVYLNLNPLDITDPNWQSWFKFKVWLSNNVPLLSKDLRVNKTAGKKTTEDYLKTYNALPTTLPNEKVNETNIRAIQTFSKITDPSVEVDGWIGTQTAKIQYPQFKIFVLTTPPGSNNAPPTYTQPFYDAPVFWGNKRYTISYKTINDYYIKGGNTYNLFGSIPSSQLKIYDPVTNPLNSNLGLLKTVEYFKGSPYLIFNGISTESRPFNWEDPFFTSPQLPKPGNWGTQTQVVTKSVDKADQQTQQQQQQNDKSKQKTQAVNNINQ
jgi:hypothetical protein